ncbi:MAG: SAM-dependent chlorinase/fluorinase [Nitrospirae bacterium]|nr:SAM-dependent chlorinase/fluorinase [Nitrospirota bacterium]
MKPVITLTTDFGNKDYFVGSVKGVILQINPDIKIVDITHEIPPFSIQDGAFVIYSSFRFFPKGSIHLVVVDPGVGSERKSILVVSRSGFFLGPDNGLFSYIYEEDDPCQVYEITEKKFFLPSIGQTFHGRDVFAPVAAWLSTEMESSSFGKLIENPIKFRIPKPVTEKNKITGQIIYIDRYGNLITNIKVANLSEIDLTKCRLMIGAYSLAGGKKFYGEAGDKEPSFTINSSGHLEIFQNKSNAADFLHASLQDSVQLIQP